MALRVTMQRDKREQEEVSMTVTLKQRTYRTAEGRAVAAGDPSAAFLVGPAGARVTNEQAKALGLVDGDVPSKSIEPDEAQHSGNPEPAKRQAPAEDKEVKRREDKDASGAGGQETGIADVMRAMVNEAQDGGEAVYGKLFTGDGRPDSRVLSGRLGFVVSGHDRDAVWAALVQAEGAPDFHFEASAADADSDPI